MRVPRQIRRRAHEWVLSYLPRSYPRSERTVSVVIPLALKDIDRAERAVQSLRRHLLHPVGQIVIVGQDHPEILHFCQRIGVRYINENDVLPEFLQVGALTFGVAQHNGWVRQQILKLTVFSYIDGDNVLVFDSDTFLVRDLSFFVGEKQILFLADEYTHSFHALTEDLLGSLPRYPRSFIAHFMLFQRDVMAQLQGQIEAHAGMDWLRAILHHMHPRIVGTLSEYELYGNFFSANFPQRCCMRYWYNIKIAPDNDEPLEQLERRYGRFNSVSAHLH